MTNEDIDFFAVEVSKGQRITAEVEGLRLGPACSTRICRSSTINVSNSQLATTARCAARSCGQLDSRRRRPLCDRGREASFGGGDQAWYRLHVGSTRGRWRCIRREGRVEKSSSCASSAIRAASWWPRRNCPSPDHRSSVLAHDGDVSAPSPNWLRVWRYPNVLETEPNNQVSAAPKTELELPLAFNGILETPGDEDCSAFVPRRPALPDPGAGEASAFAARQRGLRVSDQGGWSTRTPRRNDDANRNPDSSMDWQVPDDGDYVVRIRDHLGRGGPSYVYRIENARPRSFRADQHSSLRSRFAGAQGHRRAARGTGRDGAQRHATQLPRRAGLRLRRSPAGSESAAEKLPANVNQFPSSSKPIPKQSSVVVSSMWACAMRSVRIC